MIFPNMCCCFFWLRLLGTSQWSDRPFAGGSRDEVREENQCVSHGTGPTHQKEGPAQRRCAAAIGCKNTGEVRQSCVNACVTYSKLFLIAWWMTKEWTIWLFLFLETSKSFRVPDHDPYGPQVMERASTSGGTTRWEDQGCQRTIGMYIPNIHH